MVDEPNPGNGENVTAAPLLESSSIEATYAGFNHHQPPPRYPSG